MIAPTGASEGAKSAVPDARSRRKRKAIRVLQASLSVAVILVIFLLIMPKIASYSSVWRTISALTWLELTTLVLATIFNLFTYWWQMQAAMPGLTLGQAAVNNQSSTTIANVVPGGGVWAVGVATAMFSSWGFSGSETALMMSTTGIWNTFMKLGMPIVAVGLLVVTGHDARTLMFPALLGLVILVASIGLFAMVLWKKSLARRIGARLGAVWSWIRRMVRKPIDVAWSERAVMFRHRTIALVGDRWPALTFTTILSHLALWFVLLLSLRHVGVSEHEIGTIQVLAVFALARLLSAAPITPGGVGVVELALIGGLLAAGKSHADVPPDQFKAQVIAAALLFRTLTYGIQIPLGAFTYVIWRRKRSWSKPPRASTDESRIELGTAVGL